jgi:hypothetical protein
VNILCDKDKRVNKFEKVIVAPGMHKWVSKIAEYAWTLKLPDLWLRSFSKSAIPMERTISLVEPGEFRLFAEDWWKKSVKIPRGSHESGPHGRAKNWALSRTRPNPLQPEEHIKFADILARWTERRPLMDCLILLHDESQEWITKQIENLINYKRICHSHKASSRPLCELCLMKNTLQLFPSDE